MSLSVSYRYTRYPLSSEQDLSQTIFMPKPFSYIVNIVKYSLVRFSFLDLLLDYYLYRLDKGTMSKKQNKTLLSLQ